MLRQLKDEIRGRFSVGEGPASIATDLQHRFPAVRGLSLTSVKRFLAACGLRQRGSYSLFQNSKFKAPFLKQGRHFLGHFRPKFETLLGQNF